VIAEWALADKRIDYGLAFCDWLLAHLEEECAYRLAGEIRFWRAQLRLSARDRDGARADLEQAQGWLGRSEAIVLATKVRAALAVQSGGAS
jgi:hypothetical protein